MSGELGTCRACPAAVRWASMVDEHGAPKLRDGKPVRNPLDAASLGHDRSAQVLADPELMARTHAVLFSPLTGNGMMLTAATLGDARRWFVAGKVSLHLSHFATCPKRDRFARERGGS